MKPLYLSRHNLKAVFIVFLAILSGFTNSVNAQNPTQGEMTFSVRTVTDGGKYSPKHVLALWVEDAKGFVITRKVMANKRKQYLYTWNSSTGSNAVDAITGSTLSSHRTHTVTWNCLDLKGNLVPDGVYTVFVEFTDQHAQGPICSVSFTKGSECVDISPSDKTYFKDISLQFTSKFIYKETASICDGETYSWRSKNLVSDGLFYDSLLTVNGCDSIYELDLSVNPTSFKSETYSVCQGETYTWHSKDLTVPGLYYDSLQTMYGCDDVYELVFDVVENPDPFSLIGPTEVGADQIYNYSVPDNSDLSYTWSVTNGIILSYPSINTAEVQWGTPGEGQINAVAENAGGCTSDSSKLNVTILLTDYDVRSVNTILLYPNPVDNILLLKNIPHPEKYTILDITGKALLTGSLNETLCEIDLSFLEKGMYFIQIGHTSIHRIVKI